MEAAADLIVLYQVGDLPGRRVPSRSRSLARMAELTADAMPRLRSMKDLTELLDRDQPPREPGRPALPPAAGRALQRRLECRPLTVLKLRRSSTSSRPPRTRSSTWPTRSRDRRQGVLSRGGLAARRARHRPGDGLQLHQRLPRRRQRDRDLGLDPRADPAGRAGHGRGGQPRRRLLRRPGRQDVGSGIIDAPPAATRPG